MNTPWYRPTRVCHVVSGSDFGYRNGSGKWPTYYPDSLPPVVNIGPGSPTGVAFGYGAKFPAKYQDALFICDWSYGKLYAVHLKPDGAVVHGRGRGVRHRHAAAADRPRGQPEGRRDVLRHRRPADDLGPLPGDLRRRRVDRRRRPPSSPAPRPAPSGSSSKRSTATRDPKAVDDRLALPVEPRPLHPLRRPGRDRVPGPGDSGARRPWPRPNPQAVARSPAGPGPRQRRDPAHRDPTDPAPDQALQAGDPRRARPARLGRRSPTPQQLDAVRRPRGPLHPHRPARRRRRPSQIVARLDAALPGEGPRAERRAVPAARLPRGPGRRRRRRWPCSAGRPTQEEQIDYARSLRVLKTGWTPELRKAYFSWFRKAADFKGGPSFGGFLKQHQGRRRRHAERVGEGRAEADPRRPAAADGGRRRPRRPAARQGLDARRAGAGRRGGPEVEARLRPRPVPLRRRAVLRLPPLRQRGRRRRPRPDRRRRPVQHRATCSSRSSCRARSSATSTGRDRSPRPTARSSPAGS